ncbi:MAG: hypothetical protein KHY44_11125 [Clostridiales bacterium]|nr:hypothetical protein [Clostridiales bacterium]
MNKGLEGKQQLFNQLDKLFDMQVLWDREEACIYFKGKVVCYMQLPTNNPEEAVRLVKRVIKVYQQALVKHQT